MVDKKIGKSITVSEAKALAARLRNGVTSDEVLAAFEQRYDQIERALKLGISEDDAVLGALVTWT
jgi:hypothetical protein